MIKEIKSDEVFNYDFLEYISLDNPFRFYLGYFLDDKLVGYLVYDLMYDRCEVVYIFVLEDFRNRKIASSMLEYLIEILRSKKILNITLEVRKSNNFAIMLYKHYGFLNVAIRKNYYKGEDGILMELML